MPNTSTENNSSPTPDNGWEEIKSPREFGKMSKALLEFFAMGKAGKSAVFATPEGNFLSPKAVENLLTSTRKEVVEEIRAQIWTEEDESVSGDLLKFKGKKMNEDNILKVIQIACDVRDAKVRNHCRARILEILSTLSPTEEKE